MLFVLVSCQRRRLSLSQPSREYDQYLSHVGIVCINMGYVVLHRKPTRRMWSGRHDYGTYHYIFQCYLFFLVLIKPELYARNVLRCQISLHFRAFSFQKRPLIPGLSFKTLLIRTPVVTATTLIFLFGFVVQEELNKNGHVQQ